MKAMILAAGEGRRMRPLTETVPKPLLKVGEKSLLEHQIERLKTAGITELVINVSYLADQIVEAIGDGSKLGVAVQWSREEQCLETGGGIQRVLGELGPGPFVVVNSDVWTEYRFQDLPVISEQLAHLVMVPNPSHHSCGDFSLFTPGKYGRPLVRYHGPERRHTFAGISVLRPELFRNSAPGVFPLAPLLRQAIQKQQVTGELFLGTWVDVGTRERLEALNAKYVSA